MPLNNFLRRASSLLGFNPDEKSLQNYSDGDIVYCKNNVCVHTPSQYRSDGVDIHHPGYMVVKCHSATSDHKTLTLSWIPNERLKKNHDLIYNGPRNDEDNLSMTFRVGTESDTQSLASVAIQEEEKNSMESSLAHIKVDEICNSLESSDFNSTVSNSNEKDADSGIAEKSSSSAIIATSNTDGSIRESPFSTEVCSLDNKYKTSDFSDINTDICDSANLSNLVEASIEESNDKCDRRETEVENSLLIDDTKVVLTQKYSNEDKTGDTEVRDVLSFESSSKDVIIDNHEGKDGLSNESSIKDNTCQNIEKRDSLQESLISDKSYSKNRCPNIEKRDSLQESLISDKSYSKNRYISSSSDSSSDLGKRGETVMALETSESSFQIETNESEDDVSLGSSNDHQVSPKYFSSKAREQWFDRTAESMAVSANLAFPESPSAFSSYCPTPVDGGSSPVRRRHKCGIFSVDLGQMKSLRLFFSDKEKTCGQLVIASLESQYKILHFHCGGMDKLARVFEDWNFLISPSTDSGRLSEDIESPESLSALKQFSVCRPEIEDAELHPEEGTVEYLDAESWVTYFSEDGVIEDDLPLRRTIFFAGVDPQIRTNVWPFLLHYYDFRTTFIERQNVMQEKHQTYWRINSARENMAGIEKEKFWKEVQSTVEKDVVRTDRSKPCFAGPDNPNLEKMKNILLNFAYYNKEFGYTQGMSDILAPILAEVRNEADVFWCFTGMMSKTIFVTSPRDQDMEKNLNYLCELMRLMVPTFYKYVEFQGDGLDLLFCHRWILLCFKREFIEDEALAMWEACWSNYQTDYFHLFLVVSIVSIYGGEVTEQCMRPDEMLLYFTSLAYHMDGSLVLKKGRGVLNQFRSKSRIPCTLVGLCELCGPGMWDSGHAPIVECGGHVTETTPCLRAQSSTVDHPSKS